MTILPQLEHDLFHAAKQRLPAANLPDGAHDRRRRPEPQSTARAGIRRRLAPTTRALPMLLALGVTVIVAGFALILLDHRGESTPARPASSVPASRQELIGMFGILRRPPPRPRPRPARALSHQSRPRHGRHPSQAVYPDLTAKTIPEAFGVSRTGPSARQARAHPRLEREGVDRPDHVSAIAIILPKIRRPEPRATDWKRTHDPALKRKRDRATTGEHRHG